MDERTGMKMNRLIDGQDGCMGGKMSVWVNRQMGGQKDVMDRQMHGEIDGQNGRLMDRWMND